MNAPSHDSEFARTVASFCRRGYTPPAPGVRAALPTSDLWRRVAATGTSLWLDTGDIEAIRKLWTREFRALTTNNTLLNKEVQKGIYDQLVPQAADMARTADPGLDDAQLVLEIAFVLNAVHGLTLVSTFDADVSVELHTALAHDAEASYRYGKRYAAIEPDRFIVKVPLTPEGLVAARRLSDDGIRVNFTLGFSARQNYLIASLARPAWVNVFMGRINAFVADNGLGNGENTGEKATLASQRTVRALAQKGGPRVRQIGASVRNGAQVRDLCGVDVLTIPTAAAAEFVGMAPAAAAIADRTATDPQVRLAPAAKADQIGVFWDVPDAFRAAVDAVGNVAVAKTTGARIREALAGRGFGGLFPTLSPADQKRIAAEGKIPKAGSWQAHVDGGRGSWDGILTEAALASFADDQRKLDERIQSFL